MRLFMTSGVLWRLYTENRPNLPRLVSAHFADATIAPAIGLYTGAAEASAVVEILGTMSDGPMVDALAANIRRTNAQESVLVVAIPGVLSRMETGNGATE